MNDEKRQQLENDGWNVADGIHGIAEFLDVPPLERESFANRIAKGLQEGILHARGEMDLKSTTIDTITRRASNQ